MPSSGARAPPPAGATIAAELAKKKTKTPPPPRRVQAPKQRTETHAGGRRRLLLIVGAVALLAVIAAGAVLGAVVLGGGSSTDSAIRDAGCTLVKKPALGRQHVEKVANGFKYNTFPPTTGPHFATPVPYDFYSQPVQQYRLVHNLEHGSIVVQYGSGISDATIAEIRDWYLGDPDGIVVAPLPALKDKVALEAWIAPDAAPGQTPGPGEGILATCPGFDKSVADEFTDSYGFRGPERAPRSSLTPGA
jgi:hypothetical protein